MLSKELTIVNRLGLHARAAAKFVNVASSCASNVQIARNGRSVNGKSIMGVMMLAAACGSTVQLTIDGPDEQEALAKLEQLIADRFGEDE
ncbi:HPr family phosphocarrier protein [Sulfurivermis fontis]|uniref:HPr family phosphocarrier protein n=1 Tax=Sulfurivermis fontis TaxID=1972068 RepID=UPI000FD87E10|nr:HPr family phosphocarrier protein [Sulfurivermis fontis]